jgi:Cu/Zn superoxide dismutase
MGTVTSIAPGRHDATWTPELVARAFFCESSGAIVAANAGGEIVFVQQPKALRVHVRLHGLPARSTLAIHVHEKFPATRDELARGCDACGGHFNPLGTTHGCVALHDANRHAGDLINNVRTDDDGRVVCTFDDDLLDLRVALMSPRGRSIVVHAHPDDLGAGGLFFATDTECCCSSPSCSPVYPAGDDRIALHKMVFSPYIKVPPCQLLDAYHRSGNAPKGHFDRLAIVDALLKGSKASGNAGRRLMCARIS